MLKNEMESYVPLHGDGVKNFQSHPYVINEWSQNHEECLRVSSSVNGKPVPTPPRWREWTTSMTANVRGNQINSPSTKCQRPSGRAGERVEVMASYCAQDGKLSLKADEPQIGQRHEDKERKRNITTLLFSLRYNLRNRRRYWELKKEAEDRKRLKQQFINRT